MIYYRIDLVGQSRYLLPYSERAAALPPSLDPGLSARLSPSLTADVGLTPCKKGEPASAFMPFLSVFLGRVRGLPLESVSVETPEGVRFLDLSGAEKGAFELSFPGVRVAPFPKNGNFSVFAGAPFRVVFCDDPASFDLSAGGAALLFSEKGYFSGVGVVSRSPAVSAVGLCYRDERFAPALLAACAAALVHAGVRRCGVRFPLAFSGHAAEAVVSSSAVVLLLPCEGVRKIEEPSAPRKENPLCP